MTGDAERGPGSAGLVPWSSAEIIVQLYRNAGERTLASGVMTR